MRRTANIPSLLLLLMLWWGSAAAQSQARQYLPLDDWTYGLVNYWINNGSLSHSFVLNQPYTLADLEARLQIEDRWTQLQRQYYQDFFPQPGFGKVVIYARDNYSFVTDTGIPKPRAKQQAPVDDVFLYENKTKNHYNFAGQFNLVLPHITIVNRTVINSELKDDPLFFGDTKEWVFARTHDAYVNLSAGPLDAFLGRMDRNWGTLSSPGLILSNNPYSFDHLQVSYTAQRVKLSMIVSRLEDLIGFSTEGLYPDSLFHSRKFLTAHRVDLSVSRNFQLALTEIAVYGGPDRDFEIGFLNPLNYFYLVQRNNHVEMNGIWALDFFVKPHNNVNMFLQFLLDDIIVNNEPGQDDRAQYPDRFGINLKVSEADLLVNGLQTRLEYTRLGNRSYQSFRTWENYHYQGKGLGYPTSSIERIGVSFGYFRAFPLLADFQAAYQRAGDVRLTDVFPGEKEKFPVGVVEQKWDLGLDLAYFPNHWSRLTASFRYENFQNYNHLANTDVDNFKVVLGAHLNLAFGLKLN